jgi:hypothetical protein
MLFAEQISRLASVPAYCFSAVIPGQSNTRSLSFQAAVSGAMKFAVSVMVANHLIKYHDCFF